MDFVSVCDTWQENPLDNVKMDIDADGGVGYVEGGHWCWWQL